MLLSASAGRAEVRLASIFGNNMVLQREQPVRVWGEASPNATVAVSLANRRIVAQATADGHWQAALPALRTGGPYTLTVAGDGGTLELTNVLCGDVWLCSGQSNMQLPVKEVDPAEQAVALAQRPNVRLCSVAKKPSAMPAASADIQWHTYTSNSAQDFSAVACFFGVELRKDPRLANVPLGLVDSSFGGTTCEGWIPAPALARFAPGDLHDSMFGIKPANLYNGMIAPLGHTSFKGVLWYQGESNSAHPATYPAMLATMVDQWRKQFEQPGLPFLIVQLPEYANLWEGFYWAWIREAQARAVQSISNSALVVSLGTTDGFNLHPKEKLEIGRRAALQARNLAYGEHIVAFGPEFKTAIVVGSTIRVTFATDDGLVARGAGPVTGFAVAGADGNYRFADAKIDGKNVLVRCDEVPQPQTVRYAWGAMPRANLANRSGLPAAPFRTDSLPCVNAEIQVERPSRRVATATYEADIDADGKVTSLIFHGAQFLSNEPGAAGGSSIPGFWGPRTLTSIHALGPRLLACADEEVMLRMSFDEQSMQWSLTNGSKDSIRFQLALSPHVKIAGSATEGKLTLTRGAAALTVEGFDSVTNTLTGSLLLTKVRGGAVKSISFR